MMKTKKKNHPAHRDAKRPCTMQHQTTCADAAVYTHKACVLFSLKCCVMGSARAMNIMTVPTVHLPL